MAIEEEDSVVVMSEQDKAEMWRLGQLVQAYCEQVGSVDENDLDALEKLARCKYDLHDIVTAMEAGCTLGQAMGIFL